MQAYIDISSGDVSFVDVLTAEDKIAKDLRELKAEEYADMVKKLMVSQSGGNGEDDVLDPYGDGAAGASQGCKCAAQPAAGEDTTISLNKFLGVTPEAVASAREQREKFAEWMRPVVGNMTPAAIAVSENIPKQISLDFHGTRSTEKMHPSLAAQAHLITLELRSVSSSIAAYYSAALALIVNEHLEQIREGVPPLLVRPTFRAFTLPADPLPDPLDFGDIS